MLIKTAWNQKSRPSCQILRHVTINRGTYRIAGKFGGNYIWRNGLQVAKNKYWWNLNLAIGNRAYKFLLRHRVSYSGSPHVV